jgi:hypothetical protein
MNVIEAAFYPRGGPSQPERWRARELGVGATITVQTPLFILAPTTGTLLPAIFGYGAPVSARFFLYVSGYLNRKGFALFEGWSAIRPNARNACDREFNRQYIPRLALRDNRQEP